MTNWREPMAAVAREHLPTDVAARWTNLLRPAAQLHAPGGDEPVVAWLGGEPELPEGMEWPSWDEYGPLSYIAKVDCAGLPALDLPLPTSGALLFFYCDGQVDSGDTVVGTWEPETQAGARVLYVPAGTPTAAAETPAELEMYPAVPLAARVVASHPSGLHPLVQQTFLAPGEEARVLFDHPLSDSDFTAALEKLRGYHHQIGGYAVPIQGDVEDEILELVAPDLEPEDPRRLTEATQWQLLAQIQSDDAADMMWGDAGTLYWLSHQDDLAAHNFDAAKFTWQCS